MENIFKNTYHLRKTYTINEWSLTTSRSEKKHDNSFWSTLNFIVRFLTILKLFNYVFFVCFPNKVHKILHSIVEIQSLIQWIMKFNYELRTEWSIKCPPTMISRWNIVSLKMNVEYVPKHESLLANWFLFLFHLEFSWTNNSLNNNKQICTFTNCGYWIS